MDYKSSILKNWLEGGNGERRQKMREWGIGGRRENEGEGRTREEGEEGSTYGGGKGRGWIR